VGESKVGRSSVLNKDVDPLAISRRNIEWGAAPFTLAPSNGQGVNGKYEFTLRPLLTVTIRYCEQSQAPFPDFDMTYSHFKTAAV